VDSVPGFSLFFRCESTARMNDPVLPSAFKGVDIPSYDAIINCMHCGLCLPTCPTYALTGLERSSPRGRIRLIKAVADGQLPISDEFVREMEFCLDCQACETACPAGVKYGSLVEAARAQIHQGNHERLLVRWTKRVVLSWVFAEHARLKALARILRLYQHSGLQWFLQSTRLLRILSRKLDDIQPLAPKISPEFSTDRLPRILKPAGPTRFRVAFLPGCLMDVAFASVNMDTVDVLLRHDCEVVIPPGLGCCGSLQAHNGDMISARDMARRNIAIFARERYDYIVMNSAGCGAYMKEYGHIFADDPEFAEKSHTISEKVKDITEFLAETGFRPYQRNGRGPFSGVRVTYHDACHLAHTQKITKQPRDLIKAIPGIEYVELPESTWCCGSAGIYNIVNYDDAMKLLARKLENVRRVQPQILVTGNPGCLLQIQHGLAMQGLDVQLVHTATFLRKACDATA